MKIWISFASNHSSEYAVLGKFRTPKAAKKAEEELTKVINNWWERQEKTEFVKKHKVTIIGPKGSPMEVDIMDWEDKPEPSASGKVVTIGLYTAGYGIDDIKKMIKMMGGKAKSKSMEDIYNW